MRYETEPLGCFQQASYGLVGFGLYFACSLTTCALAQPFTQAASGDNGMTLPSLPEMLNMAGVLGFSFLVVGPLMVGLYVLYLRDMHIIEVKDRRASTAPATSKEKRKNDSLLG